MIPARGLSSSGTLFSYLVSNPQMGLQRKQRSFKPLNYQLQSVRNKDIKIRNVLRGYFRWCQDRRRSD